MVSVVIGSNMKFGSVIGIRESIIDNDNSIFTEYIENHYNELLSYCRKRNIDVTKAEDLLNDTWESYKENEFNGEGFDSSLGHDGYISVSTAVKARIKLTALNKKYHRATDSDAEVLAHFTDDTEDDSIQNAYTNMASINDINSMLFEEEYDLAETMTYFISCTDNCRVSGLSLLDKMDIIVECVENQTFNPDFICDIWNQGKDVKDCFRTILKSWMYDRKRYNSILQTVKNEIFLKKSLMSSLN